MKKLLYLLTLVPFLCAAQCPQDTFPLNNLVLNFLLSTGEAYTGTCETPCPNANRYNCWTLPWSGTQGFDGALRFGCSDSASIGFMLVGDCHNVFWDTCVTVFAFDTVIWYGATPIITQACLFWDSAQVDTVMFNCEGTGVHHTEYDSTIMDMDTCTPPLLVLQPMTAPRTYQPLTELMMGRNPEGIPYDKTILGVIYVESGTKRKVTR